MIGKAAAWMERGFYSLLQHRQAFRFSKHPYEGDLDRSAHDDRPYAEFPQLPSNYEDDPAGRLY